MSDNIQKVILVLVVFLVLAVVGYIFLKFIAPFLYLVIYGVIGLVVIYAIVWAVFIHKW
jgi:hypothetical protein